MHCNAIAFVNSVNINSVRGVSLSGSGNNFRVRAINIIGSSYNLSTMSVTPTSGTPTAPISLNIRSFAPARTDSPLHLPYYTFTDTVSNKLSFTMESP